MLPLPSALIRRASLRGRPSMYPGSCPSTRPPAIAAQTAQSLKNIQAILAQQKMTLANVVKTTVFLADINDFAEMNKVYGEYFAQPYPARSAVQVGKLPKGAPLEIECIAVK